MTNYFDIECTIPSTTPKPRELVTDEIKLKKLELTLKILKLTYRIDIRTKRIQAIVYVPLHQKESKIRLLREKLTACFHNVELTVGEIDLDRPNFVEFWVELPVP